MREGPDLRNQLKAVRHRLKLSQQDLAAAAGITRQTIGGIEADLYSPSASVALKLARALGCSVEELFWLPDDHKELRIECSRDFPFGVSIPVAIASVGERLVAHPLTADNAYRMEMAPVDGIASRQPGSNHLKIELTDDDETPYRTVIIAGCTPVISMWTRAAERWNPGLRVHWLHANSVRGLEMLGAGEVHVAGVHLQELETGNGNEVFVRRLIPDEKMLLVSLGSWEEGLVVAAGNPKSIHGVSDLARPGTLIVNRESGSGARLLLDNTLSACGIDAAAISGYEITVSSHQQVACSVAAGQADAGMSTAAIAASYGLGFISLGTIKYELAIRERQMEHEPVKQLFATLQHRWVRQQLAILGGLDTSSTGEIRNVELNS